jgi:tetratricopeptide (TPR) repeat protein
VLTQPGSPPRHTVHFPAWTHRGYAYRRLGQYEKAIADFSKAIQLNPKNKSAWHWRGLAHRDLGKIDMAIADLSEAIALHGKRHAAHNDLAWLLATSPDATGPSSGRRKTSPQMKSCAVFAPRRRR